MSYLDTCHYAIAGQGRCKAPAEIWGKREVDGQVRIRAWCLIHRQHPMAWQIWKETLTREEAEVALVMES